MHMALVASVEKDNTYTKGTLWTLLEMPSETLLMRLRADTGTIPVATEYRVGLALREKSWSLQSVLAVSQQSLSRVADVEHALTCLLQSHHGGLFNKVALDEVAEILAVHAQVR